jgi:hypothetical protein
VIGDGRNTGDSPRVDKRSRLFPFASFTPMRETQDPRLQPAPQRVVSRQVAKLAKGSRLLGGQT